MKTKMPEEVFICTDDVYIYLTKKGNKANCTTRYIREDKAAAPELLAACETALAYCYENLAQETWMKQLVDAIAKAKGG